MKDKSFKVAIIGAGPSGAACAVQLARAGIDHILIEKNEIGGLVRNANFIENMISFPDGLSGLEFADLIKEHLLKHNVNIAKDYIENIGFCDTANQFLLMSGDNYYTSEYLVIATGTIPKMLSSELVDNEASKYVYSEVVDLPEKKDKRIAIIGAGDAAFDYALSLAGENEVTIIARNKEPRALEILQERVSQKSTITLDLECDIKSIYLDDVLEICYTTGDSINRLECDYILAAIGRKELIPKPTPEFEKVRPGLFFKRRLFLAGDVIRGQNRQCTIAMGDGMLAAMDILSSIKRRSKY